MRTVKICFLIFFITLLLVPYLISVFFAEKTELPLADNSDFPEILVYRCESGEVESVDCFDYICNVLSGEMQADSEPEALKAQAVACYTYLLNRINFVRENPNEDIGHNGAYVCDNSAHCMAYLDSESAKSKWGMSYYKKYYANISRAVSDVLGMAIVYDGKPVNAVFHALSSGTTQSAVEVWGADVPYLVSVDSSFDTAANGYKTQNIFTKKEFMNVFSEELGVTLSDSPDCWIGEIEKTSSGLVKQITVADTVYPGTYIRKLFSLRSSCFDVSVNNDQIIFTVYGYGHGVGMSQNGANELAKKGNDYKQILLHYYKDTEIVYQKP